MKNILITTPEGKTQIIAKTEANLRWAKKLFESGYLQSWELVA